MGSSQDEENNERIVNVQSISLSGGVVSAAITVDGIYYQLLEGRNYNFDNLMIFVNDILYQNISGGTKKIIINDFVIANLDKANNGEYIVINDNNEELSFDIGGVFRDEVILIIDGQSGTFGEGEIVTSFPNFNFLVKDIFYQDIRGGVKSVSLGFSEGELIYRSVPAPSEADACKDSDGLDYTIKGTTSGLWWEGDTQKYGYYEKTDYCWTVSSSEPSERGKYVIDFFCDYDRFVDKITVKGSIVLCPDGCVNGACISFDDTKTFSGSGVVISTGDIDERRFTCGGCKLEDKCYPFGYRIGEKYCSDFDGFVVQLGAGEMCDNSFQCASNVCVDGECISGSFLRKIIGWFRKIFS